MPPPEPIVLPLASVDPSLALVGGKGRSLARLAAAGYPVPDGFLVTTRAYQDFVAANHLQASILQLVATAESEPAAIERVSDKIRSQCEAATMPNEIVASVAEAYAHLGDPEPAVAVRSSATAEDLPNWSFAGQQETSLNVRGETAVLAAVRRCWISLWTARAISYRQQLDVDQRTVLMGVVVQVMVPADVSGILFTANPSTGDRSELIINASFGLGESVVGGHVTPDTFQLDRSSLNLKRTILGAKQNRIVSAEAQGVVMQPVPDAIRNLSSLSPERIGQLAALSLEVERLFDGRPQDIEWAAVDGKCWLLQARPITNLPPPPLQNVTWDPPSKGAKLVRRQIVENMPDPLSPLFAELYLHDGLEQSIDKFVESNGIPFDMEEFMERPMFLTVNGYAYCRASYRSTWRLLRTMPKVLFWYVSSLRKLLKNLIPHWRDEGLPAYLEAIQHWKAVDPTTASDAQLLSGVRALTVVDAIYWFDVAMVLGAAKMTDGLLDRFLKSRAVPGNLISGVFLRGFPSKSLQAEVDLEAIAKRIRTTPSWHDLVVATPARALLEALEYPPANHALRDHLREYLEQYGHQIYTLDFVQPTQIEDPLPVLLGLKALVNNDRSDTASRQAEIARQRDLQVTQTSESLGPLRRWLFRKLLGWARTYGPYREEALFYLGSAWPTLRRLALELGTRLVAVGTLTTPQDVFYLQSAELIRASIARSENRADAELGQRASRRRELREARKKLHPPAMVPEHSRFKFGPLDLSCFETQKRNPEDSRTLHGFAVSPGTVTGPACVIRSPHDFEQMTPDTILVCATTTPAWTPLFAQALGLVTDIGGVLAHGSIVAREYGIPAVMGTGNVTQRIVSGQRITVDGDAGTVTILD